MKRRIIALFVAAALIAGVTGCSSVSFLDRMYSHEKSFNYMGNREPVDTGIESVYYDAVWRDDVNFNNMEYYHYNLNDFDRLTEPVYKMAEEGGTRGEFEEAFRDLYDELSLINTLYIISDLRSCQNATDEAAQEEALAMYEVWYDASNEFREALHQLATSKHSKIMRAVFDSSSINYYKENGASSEEEREMYLLEDRLLQSYQSMMAEADPDIDAAVELYVELVELRNETAREYGYDTFAEYAYENLYAKDYTPADVEKVWDGVKTYFVPLMIEHAEDVWNGAWKVMSMDMDCSPERVIETMEEVLPQFGEEVEYAFRYMLDHNLYDIEPDENKTEIGYTVPLYRYNEPYIFNAAYGNFFDFSDMYHEFGHFLNFFYTQSDFLYGWSDYDLSELQSQGMEVLFTFFYDELFGEAAEYMRDYKLMDLVSSVVDGAMYDEFQQRVYTEPDLTPEKVLDIYSQVVEEYGYSLEEGGEYGWVWVTHNFENPFYYISYGVSALGALEVYALCQDNWEEGLDTYLTISAMDTEAYYYSEALEEAGFRDIFERSSYVEVVSALEEVF